MRLFTKYILMGVALSIFSSSAFALNSEGIFDQVIEAFAIRAIAWQTVVLNAASWLFWTLVTISMVWTFGMMALRKADIGEFFAELVRFTIFVGFFWWLLINGPEFARSIINSLARIGEQASGTTSVTPSNIVDIGFLIWKQAIVNLSVWSPIDSFVGLALSAGILLLLAIIAVNMLLLYVSAWLLGYAGIFFLGFGGSRWTSDMAINYYKTILGVAVQLMTMILLVGIGNDLLSTFYDSMEKDTTNFEELGVMIVFCVALLILVNRLPSLVAGIITGASVNGAGIGQFGVGAAVGAAGMAVSAAATGGAMIASGAASAAGGAQAVMAAVSKASENVSNGSDVLSSMWGGSSGGGNSGGGSSSNDSSGSGGGSPYSQAAGIGSGGGSWDSKGKSESGSSSTSKGDSQKSEGSSGGAGKGGGQSSGFMAGAAKAGKILADASANLAKGGADVAMAKASSMKESAMSRIADTTGGKIASAIKNSTKTKQQSGPTFSDNSLSEGDDAQAEVAAFVNRSKGNES